MRFRTHTALLSRVATNGALLLVSTTLSVLAMEGLARFIGSTPALGPLLAMGTAARAVDGVPLWNTTPRYDADDLQAAASDRHGFTILGLGDSIMYGISVQKEDTYLERTRRLLEERSGRRVHVFNLAVPGYNTM